MAVDVDEDMCEYFTKFCHTVFKSSCILCVDFLCAYHISILENKCLVTKNRNLVNGCCCCTVNFKMAEELIKLLCR